MKRPKPMSTKMNPLGPIRKKGGKNWKEILNTRDFWSY